MISRVAERLPLYNISYKRGCQMDKLYKVLIVLLSLDIVFSVVSIILKFF